MTREERQDTEGLLGELEWKISRMRKRWWREFEKQESAPIPNRKKHEHLLGRLDGLIEARQLIKRYALGDLGVPKEQQELERQIDSLREQLSRADADRMALRRGFIEPMWDVEAALEQARKA